MDNPNSTPIVFITGGPASGKTTVARQVAEHFAKSIHIRMDDLREMMVSGVEMPTHGWTDETPPAISMGAVSRQLYGRVVCQ